MVHSVCAGVVYGCRGRRFTIPNVCHHHSNRSQIHGHSLTDSVDRLTGDGSLRRPDFTISGHVPASICTGPDIDLQLHAGSTYVEDDLARGRLHSGMSSL